MRLHAYYWVVLSEFLLTTASTTASANATSNTNNNNKSINYNTIGEHINNNNSETRLIFEREKVINFINQQRY